MEISAACILDITSSLASQYQPVPVANNGFPARINELGIATMLRSPCLMLIGYRGSALKVSFTDAITNQVGS